MAYETIPFKVFMNPDVGLFVAGGVVLLGLVVAERFGLPVNERLVRILVYTTVGVSYLLFLLKNPIWVTLFF